jgi:hypothetical protein
MRTANHSWLQIKPPIFGWFYLILSTVIKVCEEYQKLDTSDHVRNFFANFDLEHFFFRVWVFCSVTQS